MATTATRKAEPTVYRSSPPGWFYVVGACWVSMGPEVYSGKVRKVWCGKHGDLSVTDLCDHVKAVLRAVRDGRLR